MSEVVRRRQGRDNWKANRIEKRSSIRLPHVTNTLPFTEVLDEVSFTRVHNAAMTVLEEIGIAFRCDRAIEDWKLAGAKVRGNLVFPDRHMIAELIAKAPKRWEFASRNPERRVKFGGRDTVFCPSQGAPYVRDLDGVRRSSTLDPLPLRDIAKCVGRSQRQIERLFRRSAPSSPMRYYLDLRLGRARRLIEQTELPVVEIAIACGFASASHFSKRFRQAFGTNPRAYRG
jgi:trimethylamine:corrinoid methyltransferase-like protein